MAMLRVMVAFGSVLDSIGGDTAIRLQSSDSYKVDTALPGSTVGAFVGLLSAT